MTSVFSFLFVPLILFVTIVLPLWLIFHYKTRWKILNAEKEQKVGVMDSDKKELAELRDTAKRLGQRIDVLENILNVEAPNWREK